MPPDESSGANSIDADYIDQDDHESRQEQKPVLEKAKIVLKMDHLENKKGEKATSSVQRGHADLNLTLIREKKMELLNDEIGAERNEDKSMDITQNDQSQDQMLVSEVRLNQGNHDLENQNYEQDFSDQLLTDLEKEIER